MQRGIMKVIPGKMAEAMEFTKKHMEIVGRLGCPQNMKTYSPLLGGGDFMNTVIFEMEWDSLTKLSTFLENMMTDPEMLKLMPKWQTILENYEVELYSVIQ